MFLYERVKGNKARQLPLALAYSIPYDVKQDKLVGSLVITFRKVEINLN